MGAEQSLEGLSKRSANTHVSMSDEKCEPSAEGDANSRSSSAEGRSSKETPARGSSCSPTPLASTDAQYSTTPVTPSVTTPTTTDSAFSTSDPQTDPLLHPFGATVKQLPFEERKRKYEEEIRRLFQTPHPSHATRLAPEKIQKEKADIPPTKNTVITWNDMQMTFDIGKGALSQRAFKRCNRSRPDPWRRYGALRKLHEIGGTGCTPPTQTGVRVQQKFYPIQAGSEPPPPPANPPITNIDEYGTVDVLLNPKKRKSKEKAEQNE